MRLPLKPGAIDPRVWRKGCAVLALLLPSVAPAATVRLLQVQPAVISESVTARAAAPGAVERTLRLAIGAGVVRHEIVLSQNFALGYWARSLADRAVAFEGEMPGLPGSWARLTRTSAGWVGLWFDGQRYFAIDSASALSRAHPLAAALARETPLVFALSDAVLEEGSFAGDMRKAQVTATDLMEALTDVSPPTAAAVLPTRRLSVALVADAELVTLDGAAAESNMLARLNIVDGVFANQIGVRIAAGSATLLGAFDQPFSGTTPSALLDQLRDYRSGSAVQQAAGLSHLMTGRNLEGRTVGIAYLDSLCSSRFSASLSEARNSVNFDALIAAHEIGHVFGAPHDGESGSACEATPESFLMASQLNGSSTLSACSIEQMQPVLSRATCLAPVDAADVALGAPLDAGLALDQLTGIELTVRSEGNVTVDGVVLQIDLPAILGIGAVTAQSPGGNCTVTDLRVLCSLGSLAPGTVRNIQLGILATNTGFARATLRLTAANDGLADNDDASILLHVDPGADLAVGVVGSPPGVVLGNTATATLTMQNLGLAATADAVLSLTVPSGMTLESVSTTAISCTQVNQTVDCAPVALDVGATSTVVLGLRGAMVGSATIEANARSSRIDPALANNQSQFVFSVSSPPPPSGSGAAGGSGGGGTSGSLGLLALALLLRRRIQPASLAK